MGQICALIAGRGVYESGPLQITIIWNGLKARGFKFKAWLMSGSRVYPEGEAGLLMKRFMGHKSWIDNLSASWYEKTFVEKINYVFGAMLIGGFVGLLVNAALLIVLAVGFVAYTLHSLLGAHEKNRWKCALIFAEETQALKFALEESKNFFDRGGRALADDHIALAGQGTKLREQSTLLDSEYQALHVVDAALTPIVADVTTETHVLIRQQEAAVESLAAMSQHINKHDEAIEQSIAKIRAVDDAVECFSDAAAAFKTSQQTFSLAVNHFCMFKSQPAPKSEWPEMLHEQQLAEDGALIAEWIRLYPDLSMIPVD